MAKKKKFSEEAAFVYMYSGGVSMETISIMLDKPLRECYNMRNFLYGRR